LKPCNQCGKCCKNYSDGGLSASESEIDWWETHRPDIAAYVSDGEIWISPETGRRIPSCPWLTKADDAPLYSCCIYHDRPDDCRHYPVTIEQMIQDDCEMLEPGDLKDLKKAQRTLDTLMADSRPPVSR